jgi:hypothetical protein
MVRIVPTARTVLTHKTDLVRQADITDPASREAMKVPVATRTEITAQALAERIKTIIIKTAMLKNAARVVLIPDPEMRKNLMLL